MRAFLQKYLDYLPLFTVFGILLSLPGGAIRLHNPYYLIIFVVTIPVWVLLIWAILKVNKANKENTPSFSAPAGDKGENKGGGK
ncbi:MAG: hypothetical protein PHE84_02910 [bacterium]|nr:hypothetical protein [bacterium]